MQERGFWLLHDVADEHLEEELRKLLRSGSIREARIVAHLAELDARQLPLVKGLSLWDYCLTTLGLSESEAFYRIGAARLARRFPLVFELLERREIHLTALVLLNKYLTDENHAELLAEARGKSKRALLELLALRFPRAGVGSNLRRLPVLRDAVAAGPTGSLQPRSADRYCLQLELTAIQTAKIELARDLLSHANPCGDLAVVVERAIDLLIERLEARRFAKRVRDESVAARPEPTHGGVPQPEPSDLGQPKQSPVELSDLGQPKQLPEDPPPSASPHRPHIDHEVRRQVLARDGARCAYVGANGRRCRERAFLQFHHIVPFIRGGTETASNLQILCARHNRLLAYREGLLRPAA